MWWMRAAWETAVFLSFRGESKHKNEKMNQLQAFVAVWAWDKTDILIYPYSGRRQKGSAARKKETELEHR